MRSPPTLPVKTAAHNALQWMVRPRQSGRNRSRPGWSPSSRSGRSSSGSRPACFTCFFLCARGIDGVIHRLTDGEYIAVQVKSRSSLTPAGQVHVTVPASSLVDDAALMVCALVDGPQLGEYVLVATEAEFRRLATHDLVDRREYLTAAF